MRSLVLADVLGVKCKQIQFRKNRSQRGMDVFFLEIFKLTLRSKLISSKIVIPVLGV